jgi:diguanylate cyclase (GGDEF)-like protein
MLRRLRLSVTVLLVTASPCPAASVVAQSDFQIEMLTGSIPRDVEALQRDAQDFSWRPYQLHAARQIGGAFWLKLKAVKAFSTGDTPVLVVTKGRHLSTDIFSPSGDSFSKLRRATELPAFRGRHVAVYLLPQSPAPGQTLYAYIEPQGLGAEALDFAVSTLDQALARGAVHARMIALAFGALLATSLAAALIWFVLKDRMFLLYTALFSLEALYLAYLSGQGFDWPILSYALPYTSYAWNVPAALGGSAACLFMREIADLQRSWPRIYRIFGLLSGLFVLLAVANIGKLFGFGPLIATIGNVVFLSVAVFTLAVAFVAWRGGSRPAGWFLVAWALLEIFTIATALSWLLTDAGGAEILLYFGLPLSMVAAAILVALGVADRLREQRVALSDAERRAQMDPLTGVLNRRSLLERLEAACQRAMARGLAISVLFIDLDHFKVINDSHGHPAGDACLMAIIAPIQAELRQSDVIGRYGGEEFIVILSSADAAAALPIAERIVARVGQLRVEGFGSPISLRCSIGLASSDTLGVWGMQLIACADDAVYAAKKSGRNCVHVATPPPHAVASVA